MNTRNTTTPYPIRRTLIQLGSDIRNARRRRRIQMKLMAERAAISRSTLSKIEQGDTGVSIGAYAKVLFVLGMLERLGEIAAASHDAVGLELEQESLPQRIRYPAPRQSERCHD